MVVEKELNLDDQKEMRRCLAVAEALAEQLEKLGYSATPGDPIAVIATVNDSLPSVGDILEILHEYMEQEITLKEVWN